MDRSPIASGYRAGSRGRIGIVPQLVDQTQAAEVDKVKRSGFGMITNPVTLPPTATLADAEAIMARFHISGIPIADKDRRLVGILTNRDTRFTDESDMAKPVSEFMTSENLVTGTAGTTLEQAMRILQKHRIEKLPLVDTEGKIIGLITVKDIQKKRDYPNAAVDAEGRLLCGAAIGVGADLEERVQKLVEARVDVVVIDTSHGHTAGVLRAVQRVRNAWPELPVVNVVTGEDRR